MRQVNCLADNFSQATGNDALSGATAKEPSHLANNRGDVISKKARHRRSLSRSANRFV
jgi:hypothetical protein